MYDQQEYPTTAKTLHVWSFFSFLDSTIEELAHEQRCSTTGKPTRSFATERVSLDSV